jgi:hypothetical protein
MPGNFEKNEGTAKDREKLKSVIHFTDSFVGINPHRPQPKRSHLRFVLSFLLDSS